ncbi:MAG TPA: tryptophan--tRNA ligase [Armatimonadota bacterium]|nr:tryptophan--tRNA ligase [Armatimonadota bacterium]
MRVLTGIKPTGLPHLGNYLGMIRPALQFAEEQESFLFIADLHALTTVRDGERLRELVHQVAATWLALGLDPRRAVFFRQSDVPEIPLLNWVLACYTAQGQLDRAHAYKAARESGAEVNAGLYTYPVLMAADILAFRCTHVPVGRDQKQHVEIARDIAVRFNHHHPDVLTVPEPIISDEVATVPGLDGRKMSKSYDNTIPIFGSRKEIEQRVLAVVTDSTPLEAPKDPDSSNLFRLYRLLATPEQSAEVAGRLRAGGYGWGHLKRGLLQLLLDTFDEARMRHDTLLADRPALDAVLALGAARAREVAGATIADVRRATGLS